jgi:hypothetical protein
MPKKRFGAEQIVTLLRQIEVSMAQGKPTPVACRDAGISQQSYYRWRKEYGGLEIDQAKRMKGLERENDRSRRAEFNGGAVAGAFYGHRKSRNYAHDERRRHVESVSHQRRFSD